MSTFISGATSYMICSFLCTSITSNGAGVIDHHLVGANTTGGQQILIQGNDASGHGIKIHNFDGSADILHQGMSRDQVHVVEAKHEGGIYSMRVDRGDWITMTSGTSTLTAVLRMGSGAGGNANNSYTGHIFEFATFSTVPSQSFQNQLSRNFATWVGGAPIGKNYTQPTFTNVKLLLGGDGADASTTFTDESPNARTMTVVNQTQVDTASFKFGTGAILFDGTGDQLTAADSDDWHFPGEFAIEFWLRPNTADVTDNIITQWTNINGGLNFTINYNFSSATVKSMSFTMSPDGSTAGNKGLGVNAHDIDQSIFHHVLIERDSADTLRMFFDGKCHRSNILTGGGNVATALRLGGRNDLGGNMNGWLDEVRIVKGQSLCGTDAGFDVPTAAHPRS